MFLYDRLSGRVTLLSQSVNGATGNASSSLPLVSANGSTVVFESFAADLIAGDYNANSDVFACATATDSTLQIQSVIPSAAGVTFSSGRRMAEEDF